MMNDEPPFDEDEASFPFPPPGPPYGPPPPIRARAARGRNVMWVAPGGGPGGVGPGDRDHEDIMLRRVPRSVGNRFRGAAGARGITHAQYLAALVDLHEAMRQRADQGDPEVAAALERLGLRTVSI